VNARRVLVAIGVFSFLLAVTAAVQRAGRFDDRSNSAQAQTPQSPAAFALAWDTPIEIDGFRSAAISADNSYFATVSSPKDTITLRHQSGAVVWKRSVPGMTNIDVAPNGRLVMAFAALDLTRPEIDIIQGAKGDRLSKYVLDGAIWDVNISNDGKTACVATGNHSLYKFSLTEHPSYRHWHTDGIGNSVAISKDSSAIIAGMWDESGVACYNANGDTMWQYPKDEDQRKGVLNRLFEAQIEQGGRYVLGVSYANIRQGDATIYLWRKNGDGRPLWTRDLGQNNYYPKAQVTANGNYVVVTYLHNITHGQQSAAERRLLVLDRVGDTVFEKGGLLFSPNLVTVSPDGSTVTVSDGQRVLYNVDSNGHISASKTMDHLIHQTIASENGRLVLVYTGDGSLTLLRAS
jgi:hypothetical protein